jgi:hypothetical protein
MDTTTKIKIDAAIEKDLWEWLRNKGQNRACAARALGLKPYTFYRYLERKVRYIPLWVVLKVKKELGRDLEKTQPDQFADSRGKLSILERAEQAKAFIDQLEERRGTKPIEQNSEKNVKRENFCDLEKKEFIEGRSDEFVAKEFDFGNATTLRQILKLLEEGSPELQQATNDGWVRIDQAYELMKLPSDEQEALLKKDKKAIDAYLQAIQSNADSKNTRANLYAEVVKKEAEIGQPLCQVLLGLRAHSNRKGYFDWEPLKLKQWILPSMSEAQFTQLLEVLCEVGIIERKQIGKKCVGKILL